MFKAILPPELSKSRKFNFEYKSITDTIDVEIQLPDLSESSCSLSGDWGPHYCVRLEKNQMIRIGYKSKNQKSYKWNMLFPEVIYFDSPILHAVRKKTPHILKIQDEVSGLLFEIFLDTNGCINTVQTNSLGGFEKHRFSRQTARLRAVS